MLTSLKRHSAQPWQSYGEQVRRRVHGSSHPHVAFVRQSSTAKIMVPLFMLFCDYLIGEIKNVLREEL